MAEEKGLTVIDEAKRKFELACKDASALQIVNNFGAAFTAVNNERAAGLPFPTASDLIELVKAVLRGDRERNALLVERRADRAAGEQQRRVIRAVMRLTKLNDHGETRHGREE